MSFLKAKMGSIKKRQKPNTIRPIYRIGCSYPIDFNVNRDDFSNDLSIWGGGEGKIVKYIFQG